MPPQKENSGQALGSAGSGKAINSDAQKVCGIVMPIAAMGEEYSEAHWVRVRRILQKTIENAGMRAQLVWENPEVDVIQSAILQNLYENDVVICDVSGLNSNVMLEAGLRLSTKKPTIIVTDKVHKPPFDIGNVRYIDYQRDLEFNAIEDFMRRLEDRIREVQEAAQKGTYTSFVENFRFETVSPQSVEVTANEFLLEKIEALTTAVSRLERSQRKTSFTAPRLVRTFSGPTINDELNVFSDRNQRVTFEAQLADDVVPAVVAEISDIDGIASEGQYVSDRTWLIKNVVDTAKIPMDTARKLISSKVERGEELSKHVWNNRRDS
ncbi:hypothetical protein [Sphingomonas jatrophae]|uniref:Nucleoside 2-deoxyribosyltransferase n=1 Tax=Sphingomonas jatrophae TaxID=1166337 RepID=A0A1I6K5L4_9SPHN|nr:hypothetical protein [Sphingomonas jatrophae]SFR86522.1 hypothetical protein SAMN05192580_1353 [Sphingomonas jatrophae]